MEEQTHEHGQESSDIEGIVRPVLTYAAETRAVSSHTKIMMRTTEMKLLRTNRANHTQNRQSKQLRETLLNTEKNSKIGKNTKS